MFATFALTALLASASLHVARADVVPTVPGPGIVYREGSTCHIEWDGDAGSTTAWKNMAIQLMTGDNFEMVHLTTVATDLDGTVSGSFDHPCPAVAPNSAIYFYQFSAPGASEKQWATRFAIASPAGATTPPANPTQPGKNDPIPWGVGALADPSKAVPPPASAGGSTPPPLSNGASTSSPPAPADPNTVAPPLPAASSASRFTTVSSTGSAAGPSTTANSTAAANNTKENAAASVSVDSRVWQAAVALGASAMAFTVLL
ncbi:hypothetical protein D9615_006516 [Tricholomella constricta]|uniref:Yeast cell wall synthesis Kre9/Knh1-like N-terminal domain-containing protein n=1 Tax=Tricholomella constricta TaxID=117010 RepID=A0A8H5HA49_9AGAR|nr:hypothetical protein D9615_006516 [Tricholomella constricta]